MVLNIAFWTMKFRDLDYPQQGNDSFLKYEQNEQKSY